MSSIEKLKDHFLSEGVEINPPCSNSDIVAFEKNMKYFVAWSKRVFLCFNGAGLGNFVDSGYAFSFLEEFKPWWQEYDLTEDEKEIYKNCFVIADYMMWSWGYVIDLTPEGNVIYNVPDVRYPDNIVESSFSSFIDKYLNSPDEVI